MNNVKELRTKLGLTQDAFAVRLGVVPYTVRRWESGKSDPSRMALALIEKLKKKEKLT